MIDAVLAALLIGWGAVGWWLFFRERRESQELFDALKMANEGLADYRRNFTKIAWQWPGATERCTCQIDNGPQGATTTHRQCAVHGGSEQTQTEGEKNEHQD